MRHQIGLALLLVGLSAVAPCAAQPAEKAPILAILTNVRGGAVQLVGPDGGKRPVYELQAVAQGQRLELAEGASVTCVCTNGTIRRHETSFEVSPQTCLPTDGPAPRKVEIELRFGSLELVGEARGDREDFDRQPVLLAPRCPEDVGVRLGCHRRLDPPSALRWLAVADAETYYLELTGQKKRFDRIKVGACSESGTFEGRRVCAWEWPAASWPLEPDELYRLEVVAVRGSEWICSGKTILHMASDKDARALHGLLERASSEPRPTPRPAIYLGAGLYQEAAHELELVPESFGRDLALGQVYLRLDLPVLAKQAFRRALVMAQDKLERRLAEQGLERAANP